MPRIIPIFRIFDYDKAIEFYIDWLGFTLDHKHTFGENFPLYLIVHRGDIEIHLSEHHGDGTPGSHLLIEDFVGIKEYHQELRNKDYTYNKPGLNHPFWNEEIWCMEVIDPFSNKIIFTGK